MAVRRRRTSRRNRRTSRRNSRRRTSGRATEDQVVRDFQRLINMTPGQIRRWHKDPRSKEASLTHIRKELPLLARVKATRPSRWTPKMMDKARRAVAFVKRHEEQMKRQGKKYGTGRYHFTRKRVIALLNWGRITPGVTVENL